jgi:hypothetical protein
MLWLRMLVAGLSKRRPGFVPGSVHVGFVVDKEAGFPTSASAVTCQNHFTVILPPYSYIMRGMNTRSVGGRRSETLAEQHDIFQCYTNTSLSVSKWTRSHRHVHKATWNLPQEVSCKPFLADFFWSRYMVSEIKHAKGRDKPITGLCKLRPAPYTFVGPKNVIN